MKQYKLFAAAGLAAVLCACGGGGGGGASSGAPAAAPVAATEPGNLAVSALVADAQLPSGGTTTLTVTVANIGAGTARDIELAAEWSAGLAADPDFSCVASGGATCPPPTGSGGVPDLPPGGRLVFTAPITLSASARGTLSSTLFAWASNDPQLGDNFAYAAVQAWQADVVVSGRGPAAPVQAGGTATYAMTVLNAGPDDARDVVLSNRLGASQALGTITCVASGGATCPAPAASMRVPRLPVNGSLVFTVPAQVAAGYSGAIGNTLSATSAGDPRTDNNSAAITSGAFVAAAPGQSSVTLQSDSGDFVGQGQTFVYTRANAILSVTPNAGTLRVQVTGDQSWTGEFDLPNAQSVLAPGTYAGLTRAPFRDAAVGGLEWSGQGRGCNTLQGTIVVHSASYTGAALDAVDLSFEQHCEGAAPALRGRITWSASDATLPPGPVAPLPGGLWAPSAGATPATGSYVHLQSDAGDYVGGGRTATFTKADSLLSVSVNGGDVTVGIAGDQSWSGHFATMATLAQLQPGYYGGLIRWPFHNPVKGGLDWSGQGRGCNTLTGWFAVDGVTFNGGSLDTLDLRFEQHCEGAGPALRGKIHWEAGDATVPPGPVMPVPSLWAPAAGTTPASGNYARLVSDSGDYIGQGATGTVTTLAVYDRPGGVTVAGGGWSGNFQAMDSLARLQVGYYPDLKRYPFQNPVKGGLDWSGNGRGCNTLSGWFVVDRVQYDGSGLAALDLRFEQHCEGIVPALRGQVHWVR